MTEERAYERNIPGVAPVVGLVMGSWSDWKVVEKTWDVLTQLGIPCETGIVSAHRTPGLVPIYAQRADRLRLTTVIGAAGGAAHLPGMLAAFLHTTPVIGLPIKTSTLNGLDSLLSIVQMPPGVPVATVAINGAEDAALLAAQIVAVSSHEQSITWRTKLWHYRQAQEAMVYDHPSPADDPR